MWGDAEGACTFAPDDPLATALLQTTGPAHIPLTDPRWQDLFMHYNRLVHLDHIRMPASVSTSSSSSGPNVSHRSVVGEACASMARHAAASSNLATLSLHVARMVRDLAASCCDGGGGGGGRGGGERAVGGKGGGKEVTDRTPSASGRIALVAKARATCGALNLLRILAHEVVLSASRCGSARGGGEGIGCAGDNGEAGPDDFNATFLRDAFTYRSRESSVGVGGGGSRRSRNRDAGMDLISSVLTFVSMLGTDDGHKSGGNDEVRKLLTSVPELYDAAVQCMSLLLVLLSTQMYSPMVSSLQQREQFNANDDATCGVTSNYFLSLILKEAHKERGRRTKEDVCLQWEGANGLTGIEGFGTPRSSLPDDDSVTDSSACMDASRTNDGEGWSARSVLNTCLGWLVERPEPPNRSIAAHYAELAELVARHAKGEKPGPDGMYESYAIVMARSPKIGPGSEDGKGGCTPSSVHATVSSDGPSPLSVASGSADPDAVVGTGTGRRSKARVIVDATRGVIQLSSSILLLPFRLMSLAIALFGHGRHRLVGHGGSIGDAGYDHERMLLLQAAYHGGSAASSVSRTNDVLWLTDSPLADLGCSLFLLLANNCRAGSPPTRYGDGWVKGNPFRDELSSLDDNRWDSTGGNGSLSSLQQSLGSLGASLLNGGEDLHAQDKGGADSMALSSPLISPSAAPRRLSLNFESLFNAFGQTLHTEVGELVLYTLIQSSPSFAASLAVRSDLDTLVMPLLRTLYFSSDARQHSSGQLNRSDSSGADTQSTAGSLTAAAYRKRSFRSQSQLYVILILLLIFSQDASFGPDSFRRVSVPTVRWYRERYLRDISLGSVLLLTLLRCVTFNLNKMRDAFLLSNCCAVLLNISPHVSGLHGYAAMRLASVSVSCMKKYTSLVRKNGGRQAAEGDVTTVLGMYREACNSLLQVVKHSIRSRVVEGNVHLVYALVYLQHDFYDIISDPSSPFKTPEVGTIMSVIAQADRAVQEDGTARTADETMEVLKRSTNKLKAATRTTTTTTTTTSSQTPNGDMDGRGRGRRGEGRLERAGSFDSSTSDISTTDAGEFTFTYEEESDPEIFFVPYVWEVIACTVTAGTLEWSKEHVRVFSLPVVGGEDGAGGGGTYASDLSDAV